MLVGYRANARPNCVHSYVNSEDELDVSCQINNKIHHADRRHSSGFCVPAAPPPAPLPLVPCPPAGLPGLTHLVPKLSKHKFANTRADGKASRRCVDSIHFMKYTDCVNPPTGGNRRCYICTEPAPTRGEICIEQIVSSVDHLEI